MILDIKRLPEITIGHETDNLTNTIEIDVRPWKRKNPGLDSWDIVVHSPNGDTYLAPEVVEHNGILSWIITDSDTAYPGKGTYEVVAKGANGESISSGPVKMRVADRTKGTASETPPEASQGWVDKVLGAAQRAEDAAERAENADVGVISAEVENIEDGVRISITDKRGTTTAEVRNGADGAQGPVGPAGPKGDPGVSADIDGYFTPQKYGAIADGVTDDTSAIQQALANHRVVHIPGGTYKISGPLLIRSNCGLVLAQDTVLDFTQTSGDCISMMMSASIKGNHATVRVPYAFKGNVIYVYSLLNDDVLAVEPFTKWDPSWKAGRYLTDLNIVKPDSRGFHYSLDGACSGVAVYICADNNASSDTDSNFIWGLNFSGMRIAGAFVHGILAENLNGSWNHEMRVEAFIDACETGVELRDCNNAYISATIQPRQAYSLSNVYKAYAKNGIVLKRSRNTDLSGSRVWDWNTTYTLWQTNVQYEHIAMYGNCSGTILNDFFYYEMPSYDIRSLIYTDTASNLEKINILQEPFTRWFKPKEDEPYFFNGMHEKRLLLKEEMDELVSVERTLAFTDVLSTATDEDGVTVFNGIGYKNGMRWNGSDGKTVIAEPDFVATGYIPIAVGQTLHVEGMSMEAGTDVCGIVLFDANRNRLVNVQKENIIGGGSYYVGYEKTENGFNISIKNPVSTAYAKLSVWKASVYKPLMSVDQEIKYTLDGYIADGIKIKASAVVGLEELIRSIIG